MVSNTVETNARKQCKWNRSSGAFFARWLYWNVHFSEHACQGVLRSFSFSQHFNGFSTLKEACLSFLFPRIRVSEWPQRYRTVVVIPKIKSRLFSGTVTLDNCMAVPTKFKIKRMIKDTKTFIALICASVLRSLNPVAFNCILLLCLQREVINKTHVIRHRIKRRMTPR